MEHYPSAMAAAAILAANCLQGAQPSILFILSDDHSVQTIGAYNQRLS